MKKILAAFALSALVAGPSFAITEKGKEAIDKKDKAKDDKGAKGDEAKAHDFFKRAAELDKKAHEHWVAAGKNWEARQNNLHAMYTEQANARALRHAAIKLNAAAHKLFQAESDRAAALHERLAADQLYKSAHSHQAAAEAAKSAIAEGQKAEADLKGNPAFADAVKTIQADIARNQGIEAKEESAAKADADVAGKLLAGADKKEQAANALEKAVVAPPAIHVAAPPAPKAIVIKAPAHK